MKNFFKTIIFAGLALAFASSAYATDSGTCKKVRLSDVGWTDITATSAITSHILAALGYNPETKLLSVPVTYKSLENKDIDIFLGNWMPTMEGDIRSYLDKGSVENVRVNLSGTKYTLATNKSAYDAGLKTFADVPKFSKQLGGKIYGIEPGNDGNRILLDLIAKDEFGFGSMKLVESSEQGMLSQAKKLTSAGKDVVFLGWAPHPMNANIDMKYLTGGEAYFGEDGDVYTNVRAGYTSECPNVGKLLSNLEFSLEGENEVMTDILDRGMAASLAAGKWLKANPGVLKKWLKGVKTLDGKNGLKAVKASL